MAKPEMNGPVIAPFLKEVSETDKAKEFLSQFPELTLVSSEEWDGLYLDGVLVCENHSLTARDVIEALNNTLVKTRQIWLKESVLEEMGTLPRDLKDLPTSK